MDAFYASIEQRDHPEYRGKPVAVGRAEARGVVSAASYEARRFGVHSAMSSQKAKELCPELIFVPSRMEVYKSVSAEIHEIFRKYTDLIEPIALDEAFLDVTENKPGISLALDIAKLIKSDIRKQLQLIASAGISYNKFLAKIASDYRKPDGLYVIHPDKARNFIAGLPVEAFWGVGKVTARKMHALGIHSGADLCGCSPDFLRRNFGKNGQLYYNFARGIDLRPVEAVRVRKSVGCEHTFDKDLSDPTALIIELYHVVTELVERRKKSDFNGHTLTLKLKFADFTVKNHSISVGYRLTTLQQILPLAKRLLRETELNGKSVRLIGLALSAPLPPPGPVMPVQLELDFK